MIASLLICAILLAVFVIAFTVPLPDSKKSLFR